MDPTWPYPDQGAPLRRTTTVPAQRHPPQPPHPHPFHSITEPLQQTTSSQWTHTPTGSHSYAHSSPPPLPPLPAEYSSFQPSNDSTGPQGAQLPPLTQHMHSNSASQANPPQAGQVSIFPPFNRPYPHRQGSTSVFPQLPQSYSNNTWIPPPHQLQRSSTFHVSPFRAHEDSPAPPPPPLPPKQFGLFPEYQPPTTIPENAAFNSDSSPHSSTSAPTEHPIDPINEEMDDELLEALRQSEAMYQAEQTGGSQEDQELVQRILAMSLAEEENRRQLGRNHELLASDPRPSLLGAEPPVLSASPNQETRSLDSAEEWEEYDPAMFGEVTTDSTKAGSSAHQAYPSNEGDQLDGQENTPRYTETADDFQPSSSADPENLGTTQSGVPPLTEAGGAGELDGLGGFLPTYQDATMPSDTQSSPGMVSMSAPIPSISLPPQDITAPAPSAPATPMNSFVTVGHHSNGIDFQRPDPHANAWLPPPHSPGDPGSMPLSSSPSTSPGEFLFPSPPSDVPAAAHGPPRVGLASELARSTDELSNRPPETSPISVRVNSPGLFEAGPSTPSSGDIVLEDDWKNVSFGSNAPVLDRPMLTPPPSFPGVVSLSPDAAFHICTPDWRSLPRLLGRLGNCRVEASPEAFDRLQLNAMHLRLVLHFHKSSLGGAWRTVLWLDLDRPLPSNAQPVDVAKHAGSDTTQLPFGHRIADPTVVRAASSSEITSSTSSIVFVVQKPHIVLPTTLSNVATFLTTVLGESKRASSSSQEGTASLKRLHKAIDKCYPPSKAKNKEDKSGGMKVVGRRTIGGWVGNLVAGVGKPKEAKGGTLGNDDVFEVVTPFL